MPSNQSQTHTNVQIATNVSTLDSLATAQNDPSKSKEKQDFLTSFKAGKLRKNAKAKIAKLLEFADSLILKTQSMGMDDCYRSNEPVTMDKTDFWDWYEKNYRDMVIFLTVHDGVLVKVQVCDCIYHFSDDVVMTFSLDELGAEEAIFENDSLVVEEVEEVKEEVLLAPFDKYENLVNTATVKQVVIDWSESNLFSDGDAYTLDDYNIKAMQEAREVGRNNGYSKTMMYIEFENGDLERFRHDIDADYPTLNHYYAAVSEVKLIALSRVVKPWPISESLEETAGLKRVLIKSSRSNVFSVGEEYSLKEYNQKSMKYAEKVAYSDKGCVFTELELFFDNGRQEKFEHILVQHFEAGYFPTLCHAYACQRDQRLVSHVKPCFDYYQVKKALIDGYLSPLNSDEKKPTPPPEDKTRKVVALGDYQERQEAKRERLEERAIKAAAVSTERFNTASSLGKMLPFGQPILIGHHSEAKHRRHAESINTNMRKSVEAQDKAEYLTRRADSVGSAGIASDDPEAIQKLKQKLEGLEQKQELMKSVNKVVRSSHMTEKDKVEYLVNTHKQSEASAKALLEPDFSGHVGFASYSLQNNNANIRTTKKRLEDLKSLHNEEPLQCSGEAMGTAWELYEEEGRIKFSFEGIPDEAVRQKLKNNGFK
ncbi:DUF3560 domain-containing protein, partial [Vibrio artabrorum]|uniref:DUF3560 domain-containing protein n=1 Tax=Vibrio artabrorum TaxID=446374 RepID=UPI0035539ACF